MEKCIKYKLAEIYIAYLLGGDSHLLRVSTNVAQKTEMGLDLAIMNQIGTRSDIIQIIILVSTDNVASSLYIV